MAILSRRKFLFTTGWVAGGLTVLYGLRNRALTVAPTIIYPDKMSAVSWLQIGPDGTCSMYFPRMEMGQNANTGLAQIAAEELNLEVKDIVGVTPSTSDVAPIALTAGSMSLTVFSHPTAVAAAMPPCPGHVHLCLLRCPWALRTDASCRWHRDSSRSSSSSA